MGVGPDEGVILTQGSDSSLCDGIYLGGGVKNVLIRGLTVTSFRCAPSTASGVGSSIRMEDAHDSTIEYNRFSNTGMFGVRMVDAANNLIQGNLIYSIDSIGFGCAIMTSGARTAKNVFRQNVIYDTAGAGLMIRNGRDNVVIGNDVYNNGRFGVELQDDVEPAPKGIVLPTARALDAREQKKRGRTIT